MSNIMPISDVRANLPTIVSRVGDTQSRVTITVNGRPKAVLVSAEELESLEETAEILAIPHIKEDIKKSREQIKKGKFIALSDLE